MTTGILLAVGWIFFTLILAVGFYHLILWYIPIFISDFLLARRKSSGRKTNVLLHGGLSNADNCRIPRAIADSMLSSCIYDVSTYPLRIKSFMPEDSYWSTSFYAKNTVNFYVINDIEVKEKYGNEISIVLLNSKQRYESLENEIVVKAPSKVGYILVRMMVTDTKDPESLKKVSGVQRKAYAEEIFLPPGEPQTQMCQIHVKLPGGEEDRKLLHSFKHAKIGLNRNTPTFYRKTLFRSQSRSYCQEISACESNMRAVNNQRIEPPFDINRSITPDHRTSFDLFSPDERLKPSLTYISSR